MCIFDRESKSRDMKQKLLTMETEQKTGHFSVFHVVTMWLTFFPNSFFTKRYIMYQFNKFSTSLLKKDTVTLFILGKIDIFSSKKMPP